MKKLTALVLLTLLSLCLLTPALAEAAPEAVQSVSRFSAAELLETAMIICFGISWPLSIIRSLRSKSTKGKSLMFMCFICFGYLCGIVSKMLTHTYNLAFWFYFPNVLMVSTDIALYFRNRKLEQGAKA